jgi:hypothetical protein
MSKKATAPRPRRVPDGQRWQDRMKRYTVVLPKEMIDEIKAEARRSGRTHSRVVADAVRKDLPR